MNRCMYPGCQNQPMNTNMRSSGCPLRRPVNNCPLRPEPRRCENSRTVCPESCKSENSCISQQNSCRREDSRAAQQNACRREDSRAAQQNACRREDSRSSQQNSCRCEDSRDSRQNSCPVRPEPRRDRDSERSEKDCRPSMSRCQLLNHINEVSFAVNDILLYLDTHPCDQEALRFYRRNVKERNRALKEYAENYGPLTIDTAAYNDSDKWEWVMQPFPWEKGGAY